ncbi:MAG: phage tail tube protein [Nitrososphaerota archaeon]
MPRYIGLGKQTEWDSAASPSVYLDPLSVDVSPEREIYQVRPVSGRFATEFYPLTVKVGGDIEMLVNPQTFGHILHMFFGNVLTESAGTTAKKHTFTPKDVDESLPIYTLEIGSGSIYRRILNCVADSLSIEASAGEPVTATVGILGTREEAASSRTPTYPTVRYFTASDAVITIGGQARKLRSFSIEMNNNMVDDHYVLGSKYLPKHLLGEFEATGSFEIELDEYSYLSDLLADSEVSIQATFTGDQIETGVNYKLDIIIEKAILETWSAEVSHAEAIVQEIDFIARKTSTNPPVKIELTNTVESY